MKLIPRKDQHDVVNQIKLNTSNLIVAYPGVGKTLIMQMIINKYFKDKKVLIVLSIINVLRQYTDYFEDSYTFILSGEPFDHTKNIHIASFQTLNNRDIDLKEYDLIIQDESHIRHDTKQVKHLKESSKTYIGLTATPTNNRNKLLGWFENWIFGLQLKEAIELDVLVNTIILTNGNALEKYKDELKTNKQDFEEKVIRRIMSKEGIINNMVSELITTKDYENHKVLIYLPFIDNAEELYEKIKHLPNIFIIHSKKSKKENNEALENFKKVSSGAIISIRSLSVGSNIPSANMIYLGIFSKIWNLLWQIMYRASRVDRNNPNKTKAVVKDFTGTLNQAGFNPFVDFTKFNPKPSCREQCLETYDEWDLEFLPCLETCVMDDEHNPKCTKTATPTVKNDPYKIGFQVIEGDTCNTQAPVWQWKFWTEKKQNSSNLYKYSKCPTCGTISRYELVTLDNDPMEFILTEKQQELTKDTVTLFYSKEHKKTFVVVDDSKLTYFNVFYVETTRDLLKKITKQFNGRKIVMYANVQPKKLTNIIKVDNLNNIVPLLEFETPEKDLRNILNFLFLTYTRALNYNDKMLRFLRGSVTKDNQKEVFNWLQQNTDNISKASFTKFRADILKQKISKQ
jgi:superfamily II DNA or RNA helicase